MHLKIILLNQGFELYFSETIIKVVENKKLIIKVHIHVSFEINKRGVNYSELGAAISWCNFPGVVNSPGGGIS